MKVLVTGVSGRIGRQVAVEVVAAGHTVLGIDRRPWADPPDGVQLFPVDIRKRPAEEVFRRERPDAVIHLATVTHLTHRSEDRYRINLGGTRAVFDHAHTYGVKRAIFVGRHTYYGAAHDAPLYHTEDDPPMGVHTYPELADLVAADLYAGSALWRYPEIATSVLRACYTLGPTGHGTLAAYLAGRRVPTVLGFDPLFQIMHEQDLARAVAGTLGHELRGVYNVVGPPPLPLSVIIRQTNRTNLPIPELLLPRSLGKFGLPWLPRGAIEHLKYPVVCDGSQFCDQTGFEPQHSEAAAMRAFREAHPLHD